MLVMTIKSGAYSYEIHLLNVGEMFPPDYDPEKHNGFGWSRHPLVAGRDFASGEKQRKPTASLVVRERGPQMSEDRELEITDPNVWHFIVRAINGGVDGATAELGDALVQRLK